MNRNLIVGLVVGFLSLSSIQAQNLVASIDQATISWGNIAQELETYEGLKKYCLRNEFKEEVLGTLNTIHHFDTVIYNVLVKKYRVKKTKEIHDTLEEIEKFEFEYSPALFISFLEVECKERRQIEREKKETIHDVGAESYDGQVQILENQLYRYVKHITKVAERINKHSHHLHLESFSDEG